MGLKSRRPPKKGAAGKKDKDDDVSTQATADTANSSDVSSVARSLEELKMGDVGESAADRLAAEGVIATFSQVRMRVFELW